MKYEIKELNEFKFKPFQLVIDVETQEELNELFARFNATESELNEMDLGWESKNIIDHTQNIFEELNAKCEKYFQ